MTIVYVTAFLDLKEDRSRDKSPVKCFEHFERLIKTGIQVCLFTSHLYMDDLKTLTSLYSNVYLVPYAIELEDLKTHKIISSIPNLTLPSVRTDYHDTHNFLEMMNAKVELVQLGMKEMEKMDVNATHYAWIDFSICHVVKSDQTLNHLKTFTTLKTPMMTLPGCWTKEVSSAHIQNIHDRVHWRFCGGFFIGDRESILQFYNCYVNHFEQFLKEKNRLAWEVNFWSWLEYHQLWNPDVYFTGHDDRMLYIPSAYRKVIACLTTIPPRFERCKRAVQSLLPQVDHLYVCASTYYERFGECTLPDFSDFGDKVTVVNTIDYGAATKYLGALPQLMKENSWVFFGDDDQEYNSSLIQKMKESINLLGAYQNRYHIVRHGSGGIIHGFVGNMFHVQLLKNLETFDRPTASRMADDQWMSAYCFLNQIPIYPTIVEQYSDIYSILYNGHEQIGEQQLSSLGNRDKLVKEIETYFKIELKNL